MYLHLLLHMWLYLGIWLLLKSHLTKKFNGTNNIMCNNQQLTSRAVESFGEILSVSSYFFSLVCKKITR